MTASLSASASFSLRLCLVFALDRLAVCLGDADALFHLCVRLADGTDLVCLGDGDLRVVDRLCGGLLPEGDDIARFVGNVGNVHVDEAQTDLFQLALDVAGDGFEKLVAVGVDLFDVHGGDDEAQLAEDDVFGEFLYLVHLEVAQAFRRVFHDRGLGGDADGEDGRNVYADVLPRQRALEVDADGQRRQVEVGERLHERPDEGGAAVDALGAARVALAVCPDLTVDDHDLIRRALFVAGGDHEEKHEDHKHRHDNEYDYPGLHSFFLLSAEN